MRKSEHEREANTLRYFLFAGLALFLAWWLLLAAVANFDAAPGRHALFMDELISFDGVNRMRIAPDRAAFVEAASGPDQRYGRTFWYWAFIPSTVFAPVFGEPGQIVGTRMFIALTLVAAALVFVFSAIKSNALRLFAVLSLLTVPFSSYYATMPKPEPMLLLFLAVFAALSLPRHQSGSTKSCSGEWPFIFLGLAFGTKIAVAPIVAVFGTYVVLRRWLVDGARPVILLARALAWSIAGVLIAVPVIVLRPLTGWQTYLNATWFNRGHGADRAEIGITNWLSYIENVPFFAKGNLTWVFLLLFCGVPVFLFVLSVVGPLRSAVESGKVVEAMRRLVQSPYAVSAVITAAGILSLLSIVMTTQRLWGFYLYPGAFLVLLGFWSSLDVILERRGAASGAKSPQLLALSVFAAIAVTFAGSIVPAVAHTAAGFYRLAERSEQPQFRLSEARYNAMLRFVEEVAAQAGKRITVHFAAHLWHPTTSGEALYAPIYGPYDRWGQEPEVVFLLPNHVREDENRYRGGPNEALQAEAYESLYAYTDVRGACTADPCYEMRFLEDLELYVFVREDLTGID